MRFFRRSLLCLSVAALLPTVVFAAFSVFYLLRSEREHVERTVLARSRTLLTVVDAHLQGHLAALRIVCNALQLDAGDWHEFYVRLQRSRRAMPDWHSLRLIDVERAEALFDLQSPYGSTVALSSAQRQSLRALGAGRAVAGAVEEGEAPVIWLYTPLVRDDQGRLIMAVAIKAQVFQNLLRSLAPAGTTGALIDHAGRFVAGTASFAQRVGTPLSSALQAEPDGNSGFYRSTTYEGLESYTAFHTSPTSGWSVHLAIPSSSLDTPSRWSLIAAAAAALGGLMLGSVLLVLVLRDTAERRQAERALGQSQKMEAIGQLTGGIAHDFNNLLTAILGNLDLIRSRAGDNVALQHLTDQALQAAHRGAKLASQLLAFSRSQRLALCAVDLKGLLGGIGGLLKQSVGPAVQVDIRIEEDARYVLTDGNQLELALLNLALNARDAMRNRGVLTISAARAGDSARQQDRVRLCVSDTGSGMPEEVRRRAPEPFFTTKPLGRGTGLGLSQVYGVARDSGGSLTIESEPGQGTTVCITLRAAAPEQMPGKPQDLAPASPNPPEQQQARILIVDDDPLVRSFMAEGLRSLHYQVLEVDNGPEALQVLDSAHFDLLLVDFAMPGMTGAELVRAAQRIVPHLAVLVVSGCADGTALELQFGGTPQLRKPFDLAELGAAVAAALHDSPR